MKIKKTFKFFSILEYEKEQEYLREMHKSGWKFVQVSGFCVYYFATKISSEGANLDKQAFNAS